jgi:methionyl-tRNA formyltransferase
MRAVFLGTPPHAVPTLAALCTVAEVALVVTRPDRPRGRRGTPVAPAVKEAAAAWGLDVVQPERSSDLASPIRRAAPDVAVLVAYGRIIPAAALEIPAAGFVNVHFSLLPRWRGASPVVRAILAGDTATGVSLMRLDEGLDTGPVYAAREVEIGPVEPAGLLTARLAALGAGMVARLLEGIVDGSEVPSPQDDAAATAAAPVRPDEAFVDPARHSAGAVLRAVRAFDPAPGAWTTVEGRRLKLWRAAPLDGRGPAPGVVELQDGRAVAGAADGPLELLEVQPEGKRRMGAAEWLRGRRGQPARMGPPEGRATPPPPR